MSIFAGYEAVVAVLKTSTDEDWASYFTTRGIADAASTSTALGSGYRPALGLSRTTIF
jgi:hypothetical protein